MELQTIDYRNPRSTTSAGYDRLRVLIQRRELLAQFTMIASAVAGVALSFVGPLLFAGLVCGLLYKFIDSDNVPFSICFLASILIMTPILYWLERRHEGQFAANSIRGSGFDARAGSYGEFQMRGHFFSIIFWTELALIGPRLVFAALRSHRDFRKIAHTDRNRAGELLHTLASNDGGVEVLSLRQPDEPLAALHLALRYLQHFNWIDISKDNGRTWLLSEARPALAK